MISYILSYCPTLKIVKNTLRHYRLQSCVTAAIVTYCDVMCIPSIQLPCFRILNIVSFTHSLLINKSDYYVLYNNSGSINLKWEVAWPFLILLFFFFLFFYLHELLLQNHNFYVCLIGLITAGVFVLWLTTNSSLYIFTVHFNISVQDGLRSLKQNLISSAHFMVHVQFLFLRLTILSWQKESRCG